MIDGGVRGQRDFRPLTAVIVGAGMMGRFHADSAHRAGARIAAVVDCDTSAAHRLARRFPGSVGCSALEDILSKATPDVVHICTPDVTHYPLALEVAAAGAHAVIEKPMAPNLDEVQAVLAHFAAMSSFVIPAHQYAFQPVIIQTVANIEAIGRLCRIQFDIRSAGGGSDTDRFDEIAKTILPHPLSLLQRFLPGADIGSIQWTVTTAREGEWSATAVAEGVLIVIFISMNGRPTRFLTNLLGDCGAIEIDNFNGFAVAAPPLKSPFYKISAPFRDAASQFGRAGINLVGRVARREFGYVGLRSLIAAFQSAVRSGNADDLPITPAQIRANVVACATISLHAERAAHGR